jgi:hypothetical protein
MDCDGGSWGGGGCHIIHLFGNVLVNGTGHL